MEERNEQKDLLISGTAADGFLRLIGAETTSVVDAARKIHCTSPTATAALGRVLTGAILMSKEMKNDTDRLTLQVRWKAGRRRTCRQRIPKCDYGSWAQRTLHR